MLGRTHVVGGLTLGYIALNNTHLLNIDLSNKETLIIASVGLIVGSLLPDIDHPKSIISRKVKPIGFIVTKLTRHREFTHSIAGAVFLSLLSYFILYYTAIQKGANVLLAYSIFIGILTHIFLDMLTNSGVALLYPITRKRLKLLGPFSIRTTTSMFSIEFLIGIVLTITTYIMWGQFIFI